MARIAGRQRLRLRGELGDEIVRHRIVDHDALGRHADLALVHEGAEGGGRDGRVEVGIVEDDERRLAAELQKHRLQVAGRCLGDDPADPRRAGEVDPPHGRMARSGPRRSSPASSGALVTTLTTPRGSPASRKARRRSGDACRGRSPRP